MPAEDAPAAVRSWRPGQFAVDDLVDGIDLLLRATRKLVRPRRPEIEVSADRALTRLEYLCETLDANLDMGALEALTTDLAREAARLLDSVVARLEAQLPPARTAEAGSERNET